MYIYIKWRSRSFPNRKSKIIFNIIFSHIIHVYVYTHEYIFFNKSKLRLLREKIWFFFF